MYQLETELGKSIADPDTLPKVSEGGIRDHVDLLRWIAKSCRENRKQIQTWQGRAAIEEEGQLFTGERFRKRESARFVFDRQKNALRWNWRMEEGAKIVDGQPPRRSTV